MPTEIQTKPQGNKARCLWLSLSVCTAYSYVCTDKYIDITDEAKQAKTKGE